MLEHPGGQHAHQCKSDGQSGQVASWPGPGRQGGECQANTTTLAEDANQEKGGYQGLQERAGKSKTTTSHVPSREGPQTPPARSQGQAAPERGSAAQTEQSLSPKRASPYRQLPQPLPNFTWGARRVAHGLPSEVPRPSPACSRLRGPRPPAPFLRPPGSAFPSAILSSIKTDVETPVPLRTLQLRAEQNQRSSEARSRWCGPRPSGGGLDARLPVGGLQVALKAVHTADVEPHGPLQRPRHEWRQAAAATQPPHQLRPQESREQLRQAPAPKTTASGFKSK